MSRRNRTVFFVCILVSLMAIASCIHWEEGWKKDAEATLKNDVLTLLQKAERLRDSADTMETVKELAALYDTVLQIEPDNRTALAAAGSCNFLLGYGYAEAIDEKRHYYLRSMQACEQLLYLNRDFRDRVDRGARLWEALDALTVDDMEALWWWFLAMGSYWSECHSAPVQLINLAWPGRGKRILTRMMEIDPSWQHGSPYYMLANYYAKAPSIAGGDLKKSREMFATAIEAGPEMLNFRRTRAQNLYAQTGERQLYIEDMQWVLTQDPRTAPLGYHWNAFIQRDARESLKTIDDIFGPEGR